MVYSSVLAEQMVVGSKPQTSTNTYGHIYKYVDRRGSAAMLTSIQSTGVTPEVNLRITHTRKYRKRDPSRLCTDVTSSAKQGYQ